MYSIIYLKSKLFLVYYWNGKLFSNEKEYEWYMLMKLHFKQEYHMYFDFIILVFSKDKLDYYDNMVQIYNIKIDINH